MTYRALLALALASCAPVDGTPDAGSDAGDGGVQRLKIDFSGTAAIHPSAKAWMEAHGKTVPSVVGLKVTVEEATRATLGYPPLATSTVDAESKFSFSQVEIPGTVLALLARLDDPEGTEAGSDVFVTTGTGLIRGKPGAAVTGKEIYALPRVYVQEAITAALGLAEGSLEADGFALALIRNAAKDPIDGAQLALVGTATAAVKECEATDRVACAEYLNADLTGKVAGMTSASGLVVVSRAGEPKEYTAIKTGKTFDKHLSGSKEETAVCLFIESED